MTSTAVIIPNYDDWVCINHLLDDMCQLTNAPELSVFIVNDGSPQTQIHLKPRTSFREIVVIDLAANMGHQRAIATALADIVASGKFESFLVLDGDGEDRPDSIPRMLEILKENPDAFVVASRTNRKEGLRFRTFYATYKLLFWLGTGQRLDFGNYACFSAANAQRLAFTSSMWSHFPGSIMKLRMPIVRVPLPRSKRYAGRSKMNFVSLVGHGIAGMTVFLDVIFIRLASVVLAVVAFLSALSLGVLGLGLLGSTVLPEWVPGALPLVGVVVLQLLITLGLLLFVVISNRSVFGILPSQISPQLIKGRYTVNESQS